VPIYEFHCEGCETRFEFLVEAGTAVVACPNCGAERTRRVYSSPAPPQRLVKTPAANRRQEGRNAQLRAGAKARFKAARARARAARSGRPQS
jgi:putative FmdB family regulatory protein